MEKKRSSWIGIAIVLGKIGPKLAKIVPTLLKSTKLVKGGLFAGSAASYTVVFGWKVAVMILLLLFLHEGGHLWAMKKRGMKIKGMYFIPFLGAAVVADEEFPSREAENYIALMGPSVGLFLSALAYFCFFLTADLEFAAAAGWMALINVVNLLPILPLDGGRVLRSIVFSFGSRRGTLFTYIGMAICALFAAKTGFWLFVILIPLGIMELNYELRKEKKALKIIEEIKELKKESKTAKRKGNNVLVAIFESRIKILEEIKNKILILPRMSPVQIVRGIAWTVLLVIGLFFIMYYATRATGDQSFWEVLK